MSSIRRFSVYATYHGMRINKIMAFASNTRVAYQYLQRQAGRKNLMASVPKTADLIGVTRPKAAKLVNLAIQKAKVDGRHRDSYWAPIQRIWKQFEEMGIPFAITKSEYDRDKEGRPVHKTWTFEVPFVTPNGTAQKVYGRIVANAVGNVGTNPDTGKEYDPFEVYDVDAYAN